MCECCLSVCTSPAVTIIQYHNFADKNFDTQKIKKYLREGNYAVKSSSIHSGKADNNVRNLSISISLSLFALPGLLLLLSSPFFLYKCWSSDFPLACASFSGQWRNIATRYAMIFNDNFDFQKTTFCVFWACYCLFCCQKGWVQKFIRPVDF